MKTLKQNNLSGGTSDIGFIRILNENNSNSIALEKEVEIDGQLVKVEGITPKGLSNTFIDAGINITYKTPGEQYINNNGEILPGITQSYNQVVNEPKKEPTIISTDELINGEEYYLSISPYVTTVTSFNKEIKIGDWTLELSPSELENSTKLTYINDGVKETYYVISYAHIDEGFSGKHEDFDWPQISEIAVEQSSFYKATLNSDTQKYNLTLADLSTVKTEISGIVELKSNGESVEKLDITEDENIFTKIGIFE